jgi:Ran GTPase-activating protein (RanGAP) involved in mRNA processing and transport
LKEVAREIQRIDEQWSRRHLIRERKIVFCADDKALWAWSASLPWQSAAELTDLSHISLQDMSRHRLQHANNDCKVFVGSLSGAATAASLRAAFSQFGPVVHANIGVPKPGQSAFGFVTFADVEHARAAMAAGYIAVDGKRASIKAALAPAAKSSVQTEAVAARPGGNFSTSDAPDSKFSVHFKTLSGLLPPLDVFPSMTVDQLVDKLREATPQFVGKRLRLLLARGQDFAELDNYNKQLKSVGIRDGMELTVVLEDLPEFTEVLCLYFLNRFFTNALTIHCSLFFQKDIFFIQCYLKDRLSDQLSNILNSHRGELRMGFLSFRSISLLISALKQNRTVTLFSLGSSDDNRIGDRVLKALKHHPTIKHLYLPMLEVGCNLCEAVSSFLLDNSSIETLDISLNELCGENVGQLALIPRALLSNCSLTSLNLKATGLGSIGLKYVADVLVRNTRLTDLNVASNGSRSENNTAGLEHIVHALTVNRTLKKLNLERVFQRPSSSIKFQNLITNSNLTSLNLNCLALSDGVIDFANALSQNKVLTSLQLCGNEFYEQGATAVANALQQSNTLVSLDVSLNKISDKGLDAFATALKSNSSLTALEMRECRISLPEGSVLEAMRFNTTLTQLDLSRNSLNGKSGTELSLVLQSNSSLRCLKLQGNNIGKEGATALSEGLKVNNSLSELNISGNYMYSEGVTAICEALKHNSALLDLNMSNNSCKTDGAIAVSEMLKVNSTLQNLDLSWNCMEDAGISAVADQVCTYQHIRSIDLNCNNISIPVYGALYRRLRAISGLKYVLMDDDYY